MSGMYRRKQVVHRTGHRHNNSILRNAPRSRALFDAILLEPSCTSDKQKRSLNQSFGHTNKHSHTYSYGLNSISHFPAEHLHHIKLNIRFNLLWQKKLTKARFVEQMFWTLTKLRDDIGADWLMSQLTQASQVWCKIVHLMKSSTICPSACMCTFV